MKHVVFERFAAHEFAATAALKALGGCLASFELGHSIWLNSTQSTILLPITAIQQLTSATETRSRS